ncbi:MAG: peptidase M14 [Acidobacteria bacterium]|nr:peptidase M14 [Acidobacteriota bacterium]
MTKPSLFRGSAMLRLCGLILLLSLAIVAQVPTPKSVLGFHPTDDRTIADWTQIRDYFTKLDAASPRVRVQEFGKTTLGRPMIVAFISSEENIRELDRYRDINRKLADPRTIVPNGIIDEESLYLREGKTIVSISCSIHSNEIVASQMSMNLAYEMATKTDAETAEILKNTILLLIPSSNPDGIDIVANWYRKTLGTKSEGTVPPELYHHYAGHDNNRDWFMLNLKETQAITKLYWQEWFPQFVFDVHQMGQFGPRFVIPPFHDPPNPRIPPSIVREVGLVGYKMAADLEAAGISGVATNTTFDMWWHGGFRTAPYYHNSIGILSEAASADLMTPVTITKDRLKETRPVRGLRSPLEPAINHPNPWEGGLWRPRDIAEIEMIASRSLLTLAAKHREHYLKNFLELNRATLKPLPDEPQAYVMTAGQPNTETIARFLQILMWQGIEVHQMTRELWFKHDKAIDEYHEMPLGSFIVFVNQPKKQNVLSLFERQTYPDRIGADGTPDTPYDVAGWTLPLQMGIESDVVWDTQDLEKFRNTLKPVTSIDQARAVMNLGPAKEPFAKVPNPLKNPARIGLYKGWAGSMDEGWTRLVLDTHQIKYDSVGDPAMRSGDLAKYDVLLLPSISENGLLRGLSADRYPEEFTGGMGAEGIANLKRWVENGGRLVCFDASCGTVIKEFGLPIKNILAGVNRREFYNPGSIVKLEVDLRHPLAKNTLEETPAYFTNSSAFEVTGESVAPVGRIRAVAYYANRDALMSGWMLGEKMINAKPALLEAAYGKGSIVLFAFRPQHRGQTWATFPFIFNTLEK